MTYTEIIDQLQSLTIAERLALIEVAVQQIRKEIGQKPAELSNRDEQLRQAAQALRQDYLEDKDLTAFSVLDGEDFHAEG